MGWRLSSNSATYAALFLIVLLGAFLRIYHVNYQSPWYDEELSLVESHAPLDRIIDFSLGHDSNFPADTQPPFYFYVLHFWFFIFGPGVLQARLLSATAGILSLPMLFLVAKRMYDSHTALLSALLLCVSQLGICYSQEIRPYECLLLIFLVTLYFWLIAVSRRSSLAWCGCVVGMVLMVATHYYGAFAIAGLVAYTALRWRVKRIPVSWIVGAVSGLGVAMLPWLAVVFAGQLKKVSTQRTAPWFAVNRWTLVSTINKFNNGSVKGLLNSAPLWTFAVGGLLFTGPVILMVDRWLRRAETPPAERDSTALLVILIVVSLLAAISGGMVYLPYTVRYVAFCIGPYYILTAAGICRLRPAFIRPVIVVVLLSYSVYALRANYFIPYKENYRDAVAYLSDRARGDDCYAFVPWGRPPLAWSFYTSLPVPKTLIAPDRDLQSAMECPRVWVVFQSRVLARPPKDWQELLQRVEVNRQKRDERQFFWVKVELYDSH
ncbi:MAG: glycosyltransferase family 39 protein [Acidobacteriia bacterium]|nr:glycosyltransferase family 39 protein [Terriglobia bacterium]